MKLWHVPEWRWFFAFLVAFALAWSLFCLAFAHAQYNDDWRLDFERRQQERELDEIRRRQDELERRQRREFEYRREIEQRRTNPLVPERQRNKCSPWQSLC